MTLLHHHLSHSGPDENVYTFSSGPVPPFNEALISWNGHRPAQGKFHLFACVKGREWSPWLPYATWGADSQCTYSNAAPDKCVRVFQDTLTIQEPGFATEIRVKIEAHQSASLHNIRALHVYLHPSTQMPHATVPADLQSIKLAPPGLSQMALPHPRHKHLCSPASTTALMQTLAPHYSLDALKFADRVWDGGHDIFGNWVFNTAQAFVELQGQFWVWVQRLGGFGDILESLQKGVSVVVSVKGPLRGSPFAYEAGHLMLVYGVDAEAGTVLCMDPAYPTNAETLVEYALPDFMEAWNRRGRVAYVACRI